MEPLKYINHKYEIQEAIGNGNFGNVFKGLHKKTREPVAIKLESQSSPYKILKNETTILNYLYNEGCRRIPKVIWYGLYLDKTCLVMDIFESSLYDYLKTKTLPEEKVNKIIQQSIYIIETIHSKFVLHRDIKPHNFMIRNGELYLIDFGFSTFYVNEHKHHYPMRTDLESIIGSPKYASINIHTGVLCSRRDDLISIGYMYIFLLYRELPWDRVNPLKIEEPYDVYHIMNTKNQEIKSLKCLENIENLCKEKCPKIVEYLKIVYLLYYNEEPDYNELKQIFA
jgi:casein kinase 1